jgi:hypothetical protein
LLQTIYQAFDAVAVRRKVFKVETVGMSKTTDFVLSISEPFITDMTYLWSLSPPGDSYVAVAGIPNPQQTHAVIICRFAWECLVKFNETVKEMEVELVSLEQRRKKIRLLCVQ